MNKIENIINKMFIYCSEYIEKENFSYLVGNKITFYEIMSLGYMLMPRFFLYKDYILNYIKNDINEGELLEYGAKMSYNCHKIREKEEAYSERGVKFDINIFREIDEIYSNIEAYNNLVELDYILYNDKKCNNKNILFNEFLNILVAYWKKKLHINFPFRDFHVQIVNDKYELEDEIEYYITCWQTNKESFDKKKKNTFVETEIEDVFQKILWLWEGEDEFFNSGDDRYQTILDYTGFMAIYSGLGLLIPEILEYKGYILLRDNIEKYEKIKFNGDGFDYKYIKTGIFEVNYKYCDDKKTIEQYNNLINIEYYLKLEREYPYVKDNYEKYLENIKKFGKMLKFFWEIRLKDLFPCRNFKVEILDSPFDKKGLCITFWEDTE